MSLEKMDTGDYTISWARINVDSARLVCKKSAFNIVSFAKCIGTRITPYC